MANVWVDEDRVARHGFPAVCACCGKPAAAFVHRWYVHTPLGGLPFFPLGTWFFTRVALDMPWCAAHRHYHTWRWAVPFTLAVLFGGGAFVAYAVISSTRGREAAEAVHTPFVVVGLGLVLLVALAGWVRGFWAVRVSAVRDGQFRLSNVSERFASAVRSGDRPTPARVVGLPVARARPVGRRPDDR